VPPHAENGSTIGMLQVVPPSFECEAAIARAPMPDQRSCSHTPTTAEAETAAICGWIADPAVNDSVVPLGTTLLQGGAADVLANDTWAECAEAGDGEALLLEPPPQPDRAQTSADTISAGTRSGAWCFKMERTSVI
jgi:hypothetical protein